MKISYLLSLVLLVLPLISSASSTRTVLTISGIVSVEKNCLGQNKEAMVWLAKDGRDRSQKILLSHTLVPVGGSFSFYVKPGHYLLTLSNDEGCSYEGKIHVINDSIVAMPLLKHAKGEGATL